MLMFNGTLSQICQIKIYQSPKLFLAIYQSISPFKLPFTVQDDLLVGVIFGEFACGKKLAVFILAILCHVPLSMLRLKQNGGFYIGDFFIEMPIANINSPPINHLVWYMVISSDLRT